MKSGAEEWCVKKARSLYSGEGKANLWVGGITPAPWNDGKPVKCEECGRDIWVSPQHNSDLVEKGAKKICGYCALEKYGRTISPMERKFLEKSLQ